MAFSTMTVTWWTKKEEFTPFEQRDDNGTLPIHPITSVENWNAVWKRHYRDMKINGLKLNQFCNVEVFLGTLWWVLISSKKKKNEQGLVALIPGHKDCTTKTLLAFLPSRKRTWHFTEQLQVQSFARHNQVVLSLPFFG